MGALRDVLLGLERFGVSAPAEINNCNKGLHQSLGENLQYEAHFGRQFGGLWALFHDSLRVFNGLARWSSPQF